MTNAANSDSATVAGETIPVEVALTVLRGYCLGSEQANWVKPAEGVGEDLDPLSLGGLRLSPTTKSQRRRHQPSSPSTYWSPMD